MSSERQARRRLTQFKWLFSPPSPLHVDGGRRVARLAASPVPPGRTVLKQQKIDELWHALTARVPADIRANCDPTIL